MLSLALLMMAETAAAPSAEAIALGRRLGELGIAASILPAIGRQQGEELVADHPELSEADRAVLRQIAAERTRASLSRITAAAGAAYARTLSLADLRAIVAFEESPAAARYRSALPGVIAATMKGLGSIDLKAETLAAFCASTGKLCASK